jgi:hypothetical protein
MDEVPPDIGRLNDFYDLEGKFYNIFPVKKKKKKVYYY